MKGVLLQFLGRRCHIKAGKLSHKGETATKLQQELTMQNNNLKHMDGKSCPVILSIRQCRGFPYGRPAEGGESTSYAGQKLQNRDGMHAQVMTAFDFLIKGIKGRKIKTKEGKNNGTWRI